MTTPRTPPTRTPRRAALVEWPTVAVAVLCYGTWLAATTVLVGISLSLSIALCALAVTLHSSLQHEVIHGHPFRSRFLNLALVFPSLGLLVPYERFEIIHLAHHRDVRLTDPYDDPESNYLDPAVWSALPRWKQRVLEYNMTLLGRILIGPVVSQVAFVKSDLVLARAGDACVRRAWALHAGAVAVVLVWMLAVAEMPLWAWLVSVYIGNSILRVRSFAEHQAHEKAAGRSVIIEDRGLLSFLFLNNNLHAVHHIRPAVAWYRLPSLYRADRDTYLKRNFGYRYRSYWALLTAHFVRAKDPVPHPHFKRH